MVAHLLVAVIVAGAPTRVLAPIEHQRLTIYPLVRAGTADPGVISLRAGVIARLVEVREVRGKSTEIGGFSVAELTPDQVGAVEVINRSDKPLLVLSGALIVGGDQDRVLADDLVVAPHAKAYVHEFCVEKERSRGEAQTFKVGSFAEAGLRVRARHLRDQEKIWQFVGERRRALGLIRPSGSYGALISSRTSKTEFNGYLDAYVPAFAMLPEAKQVVGLAAAVDGRLVSADVFASPRLFSEHASQLLEGLILSAIGPDGSSRSVPSASAVEIFLAGEGMRVATVRTEDGVVYTSVLRE